MKARELRIGNYVTVEHPRHGEKFIEVESVTNDTINMEFRPYYLGELQPIPLTEEWLLKFGFEKVKSRYEEAETFDYVLQPLYFDMANTSVKINGVYQKINYPEYVHQLQNLYYSLTGEELCTT